AKMAPTTAYVMPMRKEVKNSGSADGSRKKRNSLMRPAPMLRSNAEASLSARAKPSTSPMVTGKKVTKATTRILGSSPKPNQMIIKGAIATIGMVWEEISSGTRPRRISGEKSMTMAINHAHANDTAKPSSVTFNV